MHGRISISVVVAIAGSILQIAVSRAAAPTVAFRSGYGPAGVSEAVRASGVAPVHTAHGMPTDATGGIVGSGGTDAQVDRVWQDLRSALMSASSTLHRVVRLQAAGCSDRALDLLERYVVQRFPPNWRHCVSFVLSGLRHPEVHFTLNAVAIGPSLQRRGGTMRWTRSVSLTGEPETSHAAILPRSPGSPYRAVLRTGMVSVRAGRERRLWS